MVTERGPRGGRLVWLEEDGRRRSDLTRVETVVVNDVGATWSPDGRWIAFASSRGRSSPAELSLWVIRAERGARPHRLTLSDAVDRDPAWTPGSDGLVFASLPKGGDDLDLWTIEIDFEGERPTAGQRVRLTETPENELFPTVSPDGERIAFQRATDEEGSSIWVMPAGGGPGTRLTEGPADLEPAFSPSGEVLAFARGRMISMPKGDETRLDTDLHVYSFAEGEVSLLFPNPFADEHGPRWSRQGRFLFATSVYRAAETDEAILASVTFLEVGRDKAVLRALHDPVAFVPRTGPALGTTPLDVPRLRENLPYPQALYLVLDRELERKRAPD